MTMPSAPRPIWRVIRRLRGHCPGGDCYMFRRQPGHPQGNLHVPVDMFWGRRPWQWMRPC